jgi:predicted transcriptional regulator of viral defense system
MPNVSILSYIKKLRRGVFTTNELARFSGKSISNTSQALRFLEKQGVISNIYRGIWIEEGNESVSPYSVANFILPKHRAYVSFVSALHLYGIIEQIPQIITLASTAHTKVIKTKIATFSIHRIAPSFFKGFDWYKGTGSFLIAGQEKALVDCLYLASRKKKAFKFFPELHFPHSFSHKKAIWWAKNIPDKKIRSFVLQNIENIYNVSF